MDLEQFTLSELRQLAKNKGIKGFTKYKKEWINYFIKWWKNRRKTRNRRKNRFSNTIKWKFKLSIN